MNTFIRSSNTIQLNKARKYLWENVYNNYNCLNDLINIINQNMYMIISDDIEIKEFFINFDKMQLKVLFNNNINDNDLSKLNDCIIKSFKDFLNNQKKNISEDIYNTCIHNIDKIFFITFIESDSITINL